jgi:HlyD family secretion protein
MCGLLAAVATSGCGHEEQGEVNTVTKPPTVRVIKPELRNIVRIVGQPSFIESYERSSVFPKMTGYIEKWNVDIGDRVKKGDTLATLFVPELVEDFGTKKATIKLDEQRVERAIKVVKVADADVRAAEASLKEAKAIYDKFEAEVERWDSEVKRLKHEVDRGIVDPQILLESTNQLKASAAARSAASATIAKAEADLLSKESSLEKDKVEVEVARADLSVAVSEAKRMEAWVGYLKLPAPFDGVIVGRNANTFDFVLPSTGDPTAMERSPHLSPGAAAPIYVVDRVDIVRIFVDIPEQDANYVQIGTKATVVAKAYREQPIPGTVTRTSWALNVKSRTLRAEIDLTNPNSQLLPGMYAYAKVIIERPNVRTLPLAALTYSGEKTYCWRHENGKAVRAELQTGVTDGKYIEITGLEQVPVPVGADPWGPVDGSEEVILGDLSILAEGGPVEVLPATDAEKVAAEVFDKAQAANPQAVSPQPVNPQPGSPQPAAPRRDTGSSAQATPTVATSVQPAPRPNR